MGLLLRKINRDAWAEAESASHWDNDDCPRGALTEIIDRSGMSMWRIDDPKDVPRFVAAQVLMQDAIGKDFSYILIDESTLKQDGIRIENTPTDHTPDTVVNGRHVDVYFESGTALMKLAKIIHNNAQANVITRPEIMKEIKTRFDDGSFDRKHLFKDKTNEKLIDTSKRLLRKLWVDDQLTFR